MSAKASPTPVAAHPPRPHGTAVDLLFEPTGDLEKDYCAYCEIEDKDDRDDVIEGIIREALDPATGTPLAAAATGASGGGGYMSPHSVATSSGGPPHLNSTVNGASANEYSQHTETLGSPHLSGGGPGSSASLNQQQQQQQHATTTTVAAAAQPIIRTTVNLRNLSYCLNRRDMQPLADAIPHCPSLTTVRMVGCGLTEHSYKQLVEAIYKSGSVHTLAVDMNPDGLFKDPTVSRRGDRNEINVFASEFRGAHLRCQTDERDDAAGGAGGGAGAGAGAGAKRSVPPKPSRPAASSSAVAKKNAAQLREAAEAADRTPIPLPTGWHAALITGVQVLSLRGNGITDAQLAPLCNLLASNTDLMSLSLWGNRITCAGAAMIAKAMATNGRLVTLNLGHNQIGDEGVAELMGMFLTRDVPYDEMCRLRSSAHTIVALNADRAAEAGAAAAATAAPIAATAAGGRPSGGSSGGALTAAQQQAAAAAAAANALPPAEPPLFPTYGDITAAAIGRQIEEGTIAAIKALGIPISATTGQAPAGGKKKDAPAGGGGAGGKRKGAGGEGPLERPTDPFDEHVVRLAEDPIASPATHSLIAQQLIAATSSSSAAAASAAVVQLQQLSRFRVPGNMALAALNLSFNPDITAKGASVAAAVLQTRSPSAEQLFHTLTASAVGLEFAPAVPATSPSGGGKGGGGAPPTPSSHLFGAPISAAIPTLAGHQGLTAPAANASVVAQQATAAIMSAPHLHTLARATPHYMPDGCALRQVDMESGKVGAAAAAQLQQSVAERRAFLAERRLAAEGGAATAE